MRVDVCESIDGVTRTGLCLYKFSNYLSNEIIQAGESNAKVANSASLELRLIELILITTAR